MGVPIRNTERAYGLVSQAFHWLIVALIIAQFIWAWRIDGVEGLRARLELVTQHKTIGMTVLALAVLRLIWRLFNRPPPMPAHMRRWERIGAQAAHWLLYGLIFAVPLSGWAYSSAAGFGDYWWGPVDFPSIAPQGEALEERFHEIHEWLTTALAVVAIGHALAALRHHFWLKDNVLRRMLPLWPKS
jgi:cytochrome b561